MFPSVWKSFSEIRKLSDREIIMLLVIVVVNIIWFTSYESKADLRKQLTEKSQDLKDERLGRSIDRVNFYRREREKDSVHRREIQNMQTTMSEFVNPLVKQALAEMNAAKLELEEIKRRKHP